MAKQTKTKNRSVDNDGNGVGVALALIPDEPVDKIEAVEMW